MLSYFAKFFFLLCLVSACVPVATNSYQSNNYNPKTLLYEDNIYEQNIRTVQLYPAKSSKKSIFQAPVIPLDQEEYLLLTFDELKAGYQEYYAKIIHCNTRWEKSNLSEIDYLHAYNKFPLRQYKPSFNTQVPYTHYTFQLPKVKLPGNYLLLVYRGRNEDDLLLSRRFMVYQKRMAIRAEVKRSSDVRKRRTHHQIEFSVDYSGVRVASARDIKVVVRQNQRWDNAITGLSPTQIQEARSYLEYKHFDLKNNFNGGREFRFFDLRSPNFGGQNVKTARAGQDMNAAYLLNDKTRAHEAYGRPLNPDLNGRFFVDNREPNAIVEADLSSEYLQVHFSLESEVLEESEVYILGALTDWQHSPASKMAYDPATGTYKKSLYLKQGWYSYVYDVKSTKYQHDYFEGAHYDTENQYEILVYCKPVGARSDLLLGYFSWIHNERQ